MALLPSSPRHGLHFAGMNLNDVLQDFRATIPSLMFTAGSIEQLLGLAVAYVVLLALKKPQQPATTPGGARPLASAEPMKATYTVQQAAQQLQSAPATVRKLIHGKQLHAVRVGRRWRIPKESLDAFLQGEGR